MTAEIEKDPFDEAFDEPSEETVDEVVEDVPDEADGSDEPPAAEEPDYKALYGQLKHKMDSEEGRYAAAQRILAERQQANEAAARQAQPTAPVAEDPDEAFLKQFQKDYNDDVLRAISLISERKAKELVRSELQNRVDPVATNVQQMLEQAHFNAIAAAHPDWQAIANESSFNDWLDSRPAHLQRAYKEVVQSGTPQEVNALLTDYKSFKQPKAPAAGKVAAASAVKIQRGGLPRKQVDMDDFDAAWAEATATR